ncbi:MAG: putative transcriptional regulator [Francisellaceae bacterium]|jgi:predicted transcriptional regulator
MQKHLLLSIQPRIVKEIVDGAKLFEFRKKLPYMNNSEISRTVVIYRSSPKMQIFGSFKIGRYFHEDFDLLMEKVNATESYKERISKYFKDKTSCHAMEITELNIYDVPISLADLRKEFPGFVPGQSYRYLDEKIANLIIELNGAL